MVLLWILGVLFYLFMDFFTLRCIRQSDSKEFDVWMFRVGALDAFFYGLLWPILWAWRWVTGDWKHI